jgi:hypothetical protein
MFEVMSSYRRTSNEGGRWRRNKQFWRWGLDTNRRRRSNRNRRIRLRWRGYGASEGKGRSNRDRGDNVRDRSEIGRCRRGNI